MRVRLQLSRLQELVARSPLSQNHWAIKLGLSRGHWSEILNGRYPYLSAKTRDRLLEEFGVPFAELFQIEAPAPAVTPAGFDQAIADRFILDTELGHGGMGTVFLARDLRHGRPLALKVISAEAVSGIGLDRFAREIAYVARLHHPHILTLLDSGEAAGQPFYAMPYVREGSLRDLLDRDLRLPLADAMSIIRGIARALTHAHRHGVLHCDVKPQNVLLGDGHPYVADFGIARALHEEYFEWGDQARGRLDGSAGTPAYVSPEQANGDRDLDARSDLYSLACLVFEMLAGRPPFAGRTTVEVVARRFTEPPPDLRATAPGIARGVAEVIERAMSLRAADRQPSVAAFWKELELAAAREATVMGRARVRAGRGLARLTPPLVRWAGPPGVRLRALARELVRDGGTAVRTIARRRGFAALLIATIAIGIGAATSIFSLVDGVLLKPLPYRDPGQLVTLWRTSSAWRADPVLSPSWDRLSHSLTDYLDWAAVQRSFAGTAAWVSRTSILAREDGAEDVPAGSATASLLPTLGVGPALGRWFLPGEDGRAAARVAVLSYEAWQTRFGADSAVLGRRVTLDGVPFEIVGVAPQRFLDLPWQRRPSQFWTPAGTAAFDLERTNRNYTVVARLPPGARTEGAIGEALPLLTPPVGGGDTIGIRVETLHVETTRAVRRPLLLLLWASVLLLVMASVNVATMLVGEADARDAEIATRLALGAGPGRVVRQVVAENGVLAAAGAALGVGAAYLAVRWLVALAPEGIPRIGTAQVDVRAAGFAMALTAATALLFSLAPVFVVLRTPPGAVLQAHSGRFARRRSTVQRAGLTAQTAIVVLLLVGATLLVRTHRNLRSVDLGFRADAVLSVMLHLDRERYPSAAARRALMANLAEQAGALPGVAAAAFGAGVPFQSGPYGTTIQIGGSVSPVPAEGINGGWRVASHRYFETMGIPLRAGRLFGPEENGPGSAVIVNETLARRFWPNQSALGQRIRVDREWRDVIGVVGDVRHQTLNEDPVPTFYLAAAQTERGPNALLLRLTGDPAGVLPGVRRIIADTDPGVAITRADRLSEAVDRTLVAEKFRTTLITFFGVVAALLGTVGVYAVTHGMVVRRRRELAIRTALGAPPIRVVRLVLGTTAAVTGGGTAIGLVLALVAGRALRPFLYGVAPVDPASYAVVAAVVGWAALSATWLPARRASRLEPMAALRSE